MANSKWMKVSVNKPLVITNTYLWPAIKLVFEIIVYYFFLKDGTKLWNLDYNNLTNNNTSRDSLHLN